MLLWFLHQINLFDVQWISNVYYHNIKTLSFILVFRSNHVTVQYKNIFSSFAISTIKPIWSEQIVSSFLWLCLVDLWNIVPQSFDSIDHRLCFWPFCHANKLFEGFSQNYDERRRFKLFFLIFYETINFRHLSVEILQFLNFFDIK